MKSHPPRFVARIGLDRADQKHDFCVRAGPKAQLEYGVVQHSPESIADWAHSLRQRFRGRPVAICLEHKAGPVVSALLKYSFLTLFPISPRALARYRESFSQGGAKDDPTDACLQLDYLLKHPRKKGTDLFSRSPLTAKMGTDLFSRSPLRLCSVLALPYGISLQS